MEIILPPCLSVTHTKIKTRLVGPKWTQLIKKEVRKNNRKCHLFSFKFKSNKKRSKQLSVKGGGNCLT